MKFTEVQLRANSYYIYMHVCIEFMFKNEYAYCLLGN